MQLILNALLYVPEEGSFIWKTRPREDFDTLRGFKIFNTRFAGTKAGSILGDGYEYIQIRGHKFGVHRLVWFFEKGAMPDNEIDRIDGDKCNNLFGNLREVDRTGNNRNLGLFSTNTSGHVGVTWRPKRGKYTAQITVKSKPVHLGYFAEFEEAVAARKAAEEKYGYHPNNGGVRK